jgi:hypothetical protein
MRSVRADAFGFWLAVGTPESSDPVAERAVAWPVSQAPSVAAVRMRSWATSMTSRSCLASPDALLALTASPSMTIQ